MLKLSQPALHSTYKFLDKGVVQLFALAFALLSISAVKANSNNSLPGHKSTSTVSCNPASDKQVLTDLYNQTDGANWRNTWDLSTPMDTWFGVTVNAQGCVTCLDLDGHDACSSNIYFGGPGGNLLSGTLPTSIGQLSSLEKLFLAENYLTGQIPTEIGNLSLLTHLRLNSNNLSGEIPTSIYGLTSLEELSVQENDLTGIISPDIGNLTQLVSLVYSINDISGPIPEEMGLLTNLEYLSIFNNDHTGTIPSTMSNLVNLEHFAVSDNELIGPIPAWLGDLPNLTLFQGTYNNFSGCFAPELSSLCSQDVWIVNNPGLPGNGDFAAFCSTGAGACASSPCNGSDIDALVAIYNSLGGPNWWNNSGWVDGMAGSNCDVCTWYGLSCDSNGRITRIDLNNNGLSGILPPEIGGMDKLQFLNMNFNSVSGGLPAELGQLSELQEIDFWYNDITGEIPPELANIPTLTKLSLSDNALGGPLPVFIGSMTQLEVFSGAQNSFTGPIPSEYSALVNLTAFGFSYNQLDGEIPDFFGNFSQLETVFLNGNSFTGSIPSSFGNLNSLDRLHLDFNNLTGGIPESLGNLPSLTRMTLRNNNLSGCVPYGFLSYCNNYVTISNNPCLSHADFSSFCNSPTCVLSTDPSCDFSACSNGVQDGQETGVDCGGSCQTCPIDCSAYPDLDALLAIYNSTNGANWYNNNGWVNGVAGFDCNYCSWYGVFCDANSRVKELNLFANNVNGTLPSAVGQLTALTHLEIPQNFLSGPLPTELGDMTNLENLSLFGNELTGPVPSSLGSLSQLTFLGLGDNELSGELPLFLTTMTQLTFLALNGNDFEGRIPAEFSNLINLQTLSLQQNDLSGCIPESLTAFCGSTYVNVYDNPCLSHNANFNNLCSGELCSLPTDSSCDFSSCSNGMADAGEIEVDCGGLCPPCQVDCAGNPDFNALMAFYNSTNGPAWGTFGWSGGAAGTNCDVCSWQGVTCNANGRVIKLFFKSNNLDGPLPNELDQLTELREIIITFSNLTGQIPSSIGNLEHLEDLNLYGNAITGSIPASLANLTELKYINLSFNQLSGCYDSSLQVLCTQLDPEHSTNESISYGNQFDAPWEAFCNGGVEACDCSTAFFGDGQLPNNHDLIAVTSNDCPTKGTIHFNNDPNDPCGDEDLYWMITDTQTPPVDINDDRIKSVEDDYTLLDPGLYYFYLIARPNEYISDIVYLPPTTITVDELECFPCIDEVEIDEQADVILDDETIRSADYIELEDVAVEQDLETFAVDYFEIHGPFEVDPSIEFSVTISNDCECTIGDPCDDGDPCTLNDTFDGECGCIGVLDPACLPDCVSGFDHGDSCDDGDSCTDNDVIDTNCNCVGTVINNCTSDCSSGLNIGDSCDDGDACTDNDAIDANCNCVGTDIPNCTTDCSNGLNIGDVCDDGNDCTANDLITADCNCAGTAIAGCATDCLSGFNIGDECDDGNACTDNDLIDGNCDCIGTDIPECESDNCTDSETLGTSCDDLDECTENDIWLIDDGGDCVCLGALIDGNNNGECDLLEPCDESGNILSRTLKSNECTAAQSLDIIVSEFSNGTTGVDEYIELFVRGKGVFDLRGVIVDDKEGEYKSGNGFSAGRIRFANHSNWATVKGGSIILIYNHKHKHQQIASDDPSDMNRDNIFITPLSQPYFYGEEKNNESKYHPIPPAWDLIWLYDKNDEINIRSCDERLLHKISYGYETSSRSNLADNTIYLDKSVLKGLVFSDMMNGHKVGTKEMSPGKYNNRRHRNFVKNGN